MSQVAEDWVSDQLSMNMTSSVENSTDKQAVLVSLDDCIPLKYLQFLPWETPQDPITFEVWKKIGHYEYGLMLPLLFLTSTLTNSANMVVFYKQGLKDRIHLCLFWLALSDFIFMITSFCTYIDHIHLWIINAQVSDSVSAQFFIKHKLLILHGFSWVSTVTTTIISCERCFCVVSPFHAKHFVKTKAMATVLFLSSVVIIGGFYSVSIKWGVICIYDPLTNITFPFLFPSKEYINNKELVDVLDENVYGLVIPGFCLVVVSATTAVTMLKLRKMAAWRESTMSSSSELMPSRDLALTRTLVLLCIMFVACYIPVVTVHNIGRIIPELRLGGRLHNTYNLLVTIAQLLIYINFSTSFFIYYKTGSQFREMTKNLFQILKAQHCVRGLSRQHETD